MVQAPVGVMLVNLGSPAAPTAPALRRYLAEFLSDPRVVDLPRVLWLPLLHGLVPPHPADPGYVAALAERCRSAAGSERFDHTVLSFHGLPQKQVDRGDPYRDQCEATAAALAAALDLPPEAWSLAFQSRFGPAPWLQPYTDVLVRSLAERAPRVLVACPGFTADCLETLDEIGEVLAADFRRAGGRELRLVPALNDSPLWIAAMERMVRRAAVEHAA